MLFLGQGVSSGPIRVHLWIYNLKNDISQVHGYLKLDCKTSLSKTDDVTFEFSIKKKIFN